jgi:hypothetical protein
MKKLLASLLLATCGLAQADITVVVPGPTGWWTVVMPELAKHLGEKITPEIIQGARDIPAGNKWHDKFRFEKDTMWFSNGGQAEAFLLEDVKFNFKDYEPIFAQNLSIVVGYNKTQDPYTTNIKFGAGSGMNPDAMAITMMVCGELPNMSAYLDCYKKKITYVKGMKVPEIALAYTRGELTAIRQNPFDYNKDFVPLDFNQTWFSAGLLDIKTGKIVPDTNYAVGTRSFPEAYKAKWGKDPKGEFYDAWVLVKNYRDVLQKVIWVNKGDPNKDKLVVAARKMIADPESQKIIAEKLGTYPWWVASEVNQAQQALEKQLTKKALNNLVWWTTNAYQIDAVFKPEIVSKAK